jgi:hypothetical protein
MAIDNQYDGEVVDGATKLQMRERAVSTRSSPTDNPTAKSKAHLDAVCRDTLRQVYQVDHDSTAAAHNHEVDQMVTEADFPRCLASQCHLPMTTRCKIYSPEHAEALHRAQTALARLNLISITIFGEAHLLDVNE